MKTQLNVTNMFILNADALMLAQLADALVLAGELNAKQHAKLITLDVAKQRVSIGTRYANSKQYGSAFAAGTLTLELDNGVADQQQSAGAGADDTMFNYEYDQQQSAGADQQQQQQRTRSSNVKSAKQWLRELLSANGASYTLAELCKLSGKSEVNIRTMLSDLRSAKYCGSAGVFNTKSTRVNGAWYYSKA